jgi:hypothetical protein
MTFDERKENWRLKMLTFCVPQMKFFFSTFMTFDGTSISRIEGSILQDVFLEVQFFYLKKKSIVLLCIL